MHYLGISSETPPHPDRRGYSSFADVSHELPTGELANTVWFWTASRTPGTAPRLEWMSGRLLCAVSGCCCLSTFCHTQGRQVGWRVVLSHCRRQRCPTASLPRPLEPPAIIRHLTTHNTHTDTDYLAQRPKPQHTKLFGNNYLKCH